MTTFDLLRRPVAAILLGIIAGLGPNVFSSERMDIKYEKFLAFARHWSGSLAAMIPGEQEDIKALQVYVYWRNRNFVVESEGAKWKERYIDLYRAMAVLLGRYKSQMSTEEYQIMNTDLLKFGWDR